MAEYLLRKGSLPGPAIQRAQRIADRVQANVCAAAFVGDGEPISANADRLAFVGDADAARAAYDDAALIAAECAKPGEITVALEPRLCKWMLPQLRV